jgi:hypothetical protein
MAACTAAAAAAAAEVVPTSFVHRQAQASTKFTE